MCVWNKACRITVAMTISDILIIYFSFGAPFAVYQFIKGRPTSTFRSVAGTAFRFLFWLPILLILGITAILKFAGSSDFAGANDLDARMDKDIRDAQSAVADLFRMTERHISIHEFHEILERYTGLSLLAKSRAMGAAAPHHEIFAITEHENTQLAAICFERRNRARLFRHHIDARADFLKVIKECSFLDELMLPTAIKLAELLKDAAASAELFEVSYTRKSEVPMINQSGEDLWLPKIQPASKSERLTAT